LLVADDDDGLALEPREAADERVIVRVHAVAVELVEIREAALDVVERVRTLRVARELRDLPSAETREDAPRERLALVLEPFDLFADVQLRVFANELERVDSRLELRDRLFEIQEPQIHTVPRNAPAANLTVNPHPPQVRWPAPRR